MSLTKEQETLIAKKPKSWWAQLWCRHAWDCISDVWTCTVSTVRYKCTKCGKTEGL